MRSQKPKTGTITDLSRERARASVSKFQRYRMSKVERGQKLLRVWVTDPTHPGFAEEARRQAAVLRGRPEEQEALAFIEQVFDWPE